MFSLNQHKIITQSVQVDEKEPLILNETKYRVAQFSTKPINPVTISNITFTSASTKKYIKHDI